MVIVTDHVSYWFYDLIPGYSGQVTPNLKEVRLWIQIENLSPFIYSIIHKIHIII